MAQGIPSLLSMLAQVPDPRARRGRRYAWAALLLLWVVALLCGANTQRACARWSANVGGARRRRLGLPGRRGPSLATLHRVLHQVSVPALETCLGAWLGQVRAAWPQPQGPARWLDGIAIDGKTLRGARRLGAKDVHLLSACCQRHTLVLGQQAVPDTTNELGAIGPFLATLPLAGETVTFDAEFTQWLVARQVVAQGGAYLMVVKANQPTLWRACQEATTRPRRRPCRQYGQARTIERAHGRLEERTLTAAAAPADFGFPAAQQVLRLDRRRIDKHTGEVLTADTVYAVTSLGPDRARPPALLRLWRRHWWIENRVHWVRDAVCGEDASTTHTGTAPQALAALRNLVLSLLHRWKHAEITAAREYYASHPTVLFRHLGLPAHGL
jgi:predicted transposase YbfD/YdcC